MSKRRATPPRAWFMDTTASRALNRLDEEPITLEEAAERLRRLPVRGFRVVKREGAKA